MMHPFRRLAVGAALAGAAFAATPALASASSTCSFDFKTHNVSIQDGSGGAALHVNRASNGLIMLADGSGVPGPCWDAGGPLATVDNTTEVYIQGPAVGKYDSIQFDETGGPFESTAWPSRLKLDVMSTSSDLYALSVQGTTTAGNSFHIGGKGSIDLDGDLVVDVNEAYGASDVWLYGGDSYDTFDGRGFNSLGPATVPLHMAGGAKDDSFFAGREHNYVSGGDGADSFYLNANGYPDSFTGGEGSDRAFLDTFDIGDAEARYFPGH